MSELPEGRYPDRSDLDKAISSEDQNEVLSFIVDVYPSGMVVVEAGGFPMYALVSVLERALEVSRSWVVNRSAVIAQGGTPIYTDMPDDEDDEEDEDDADSEEGEQGA